LSRLPLLSIVVSLSLSPSQSLAEKEEGGESSSSPFLLLNANDSGLKTLAAADKVNVTLLGPFEAVPSLQQRTVRERVFISF